MGRQAGTTLVASVAFILPSTVAAYPLCHGSFPAVCARGADAAANPRPLARATEARGCFPQQPRQVAHLAARHRRLAREDRRAMHLLDVHQLRRGAAVHADDDRRREVLPFLGGQRANTRVPARRRRRRGPEGAPSRPAAGEAAVGASLLSLLLPHRITPTRRREVIRSH